MVCYGNLSCQVMYDTYDDVFSNLNKLQTEHFLLFASYLGLLDYCMQFIKGFDQFLCIPNNHSVQY